MKKKKKKNICTWCNLPDWRKMKDAPRNGVHILIKFKDVGVLECYPIGADGNVWESVADHADTSQPLKWLYMPAEVKQ